MHFNPANHHRSQGAVERIEGWMLGIMLAEAYVVWPKRWDEYALPAC